MRETLTLEYKASPALTRDSKNVLELCKDVSAMANSAGGQVIYGIEEDKQTHKPKAVDNGVTDDKITREWIHQILGSNVHPRIDGLIVQRIPLSKSGFGFVITIPSTIVGPHQAPDKKYYKRFELEAKPMEDHEVRDVMRRGTTPILKFTLGLSSGRKSAISIRPAVEVSEPFPLFVSISNLSTSPALYSMLTLGLDPKLIVNTSPIRSIGKYADNDGMNLAWYQRHFAVPSDLPFFKESSIGMPDVTFQVSTAITTISQLTIRTIIETPGYSETAYWTLQLLGRQLEIYQDEVA